MNSVLRLIEGNFGWILLLFAASAFILPDAFLWAKEYTDIFIMLALFLGCLKIDFTEMLHLRQNLSKMLLFIGFNMIIYPVLFYFLSFLAPFEMRIGIFIVMCISGAVMTPLLASLMNLKILWAISYVVLSSLLVPFSLPLLVDLMFGIRLDLSLTEMILFLMKIVFIPVFSAVAIRLLFRSGVMKILKYTGAGGTITISYFLAVVIAIHQRALMDSALKLSTLWIILIMTFVYFARFIIGYLAPSADGRERWTNALMFGNLNTGLSIIIASEFFGPEIILVVLLSEVPYVLSQPLFQRLFNKFKPDFLIHEKSGS